MNIAIIGNFNIYFTTESDLKWSLESMGHTIIPYQENNANTFDIVQDINLGKIDLLLYIHTHGWITPGPYTIDDVLKAAESKSVPTVSFHLDLFNGLDRAKDVANHPFWHTKYVFSADGGSEQFFKDKGINHFWLKPGVVKRDCYLGKYRPEFECDVAFVGSGDYAHAQWPYRQKLLNWLNDNYGTRFMHIGRPNRVLRGQDLNDFYASAKVVVGDTLCVGFNHPNYWSDRVTETLGRGGFLIHPFIKGMEQDFIPGVDLEFYNYNDFDRLRYLIEYYLKHYEQRKHIQLNGHELVKNNMTYTERMRQLLYTVAEYEPEFKEKL